MDKIMEVVSITQEFKEGYSDASIIRSPEDASKVAQEYIGNKDREHFLVMCLNTKNKVTAVHIAHVGSLNASVVHPREVYKVAILNNSASIIVAHQHPSLDVQPSQEDIQITKRLYECGKLLGIELLDHVIVGEGFVSLKEKGYLN